MVVCEVGSQKFFVDGYMKKILDYVKPKVLHNKDFFCCLVDGRPGSGKSTGVGQWAYYLSDGKLTLVNCCFSVLQFKELINNSKPGDVVWLDEGFELNRRTTQSAANMEMLDVLNKARSKQIFVFIVLPMVYDLDKNIILGLAHLFVHFYRHGEFGQRGFYKVYDRNSLRKLWLYCRKDLIYADRIAMPNFFARTTKWFPFEESEYENKKHIPKPSKLETIESKEERNNKVIEMHEQNIPADDIANKFGINRATVFRIIKRGFA